MNKEKFLQYFVKFSEKNGLQIMEFHPNDITGFGEFFGIDKEKKVQLIQNFIREYDDN